MTERSGFVPVSSTTVIKIFFSILIQKVTLVGVLGWKMHGIILFSGGNSQWPPCYFSNTIPELGRLLYGIQGTVFIVLYFYIFIIMMNSLGHGNERLKRGKEKLITSSSFP